MPPRVREYSFGLATCRLGDRVRRQKNPFTGEPIEASIDPGLSASERQAVRDLLAGRGAVRDTDDEFHNIRYPDGSRICLGFGDLDGLHRVTGAEVNVICYRLSAEILGFLHELATMGNLALVALEGPPP